MTNTAPAQIEASFAPCWDGDDRPWIAALTSADGTLIRRSDFWATKEEAIAELQEAK